MTAPSVAKPRLAVLTIGALGVVYGDIGTSPLYALRECFAEAHGVQPDAANVIGVLSLMVWALILIVCVQYLGFVLRADNRGEGGILALLALAFGSERKESRRRAALVALGVFGAALLYGDGMITPCITVLGAVEGLEVATPIFADYIVPISIAILIGLFAFQSIGTSGVGRVFGPVMLIWFLTIAVLGVRGIVMAPQVLASFDPSRGVVFASTHGFRAFLVVGTVFLVVTGAEALYADLGHFGIRPIRLAWFAIALPALLLNYLGQGGLLLQHPGSITNPFYLLTPSWGLYPLVVLATVTSAVASQAVISGAFSVTTQAIHLGYLPRMAIRHTSSHERGQVYLPFVNWTLMVCCVGLALGFRSSSSLAAAYGIAVTLTMLITSVLFYFAARRMWGWSAMTTGLLCAAFIAIEVVFFCANAVKVAHGGWFPLLVALALFTVMATWKRGRLLLWERVSRNMRPIEGFLEGLQKDPPLRVTGTAVYMAGSAAGVPLALLHNLRHNKVLHERIVLLTIQTTEAPHVERGQHVQIVELPQGFFRVVAQYGFMETPQIQAVLAATAESGLDIRIAETTFFLSRETILPSHRPRMARWRALLFGFLSRNAQPATAFFGLPVGRVVELGVQVEL